MATRDAVSPELKLLSVLLGAWCGFFGGALWLRALRAVPADPLPALGGAGAVVGVLVAASPFLGFYALWTASARVRRAIHGSFLVAFALAFSCGVWHEAPPLFPHRHIELNSPPPNPLFPLLP